MVILSRPLLPAALALLLLAFQEGRDRTPPLARKGGFLLDRQVCADCHEDEDDRITRSFHAPVPESEHTRRCETCHGPGELHSDSQEPAQITHPAKLGAKAQRDLCSGCHADQLAEHGGPLDRMTGSGKVCTHCHRVHIEKRHLPGAGDPEGFATRKEVDAGAKPLGNAKCRGCHGDKPANLEGGPHGILLSTETLPDGRAWNPDRTCEHCHGRGSKHAETFGRARFISRPDRGEASLCRDCHPEVDPRSFHWPEEANPLLGAPGGAGLSCTTCHRIHGPGDPVSRKGLPSKPRPTTRPARDPKQAFSPELDVETGPWACLRCHAPAYRALSGTIHEALGSRGGGCLACHPGGGRHAAGGGRRGWVLLGTTAPAQVRTCLSCHGRGARLCAFPEGVHGREGLGCLSCHAPAAPGSPRVWRQEASDRCKGCHQDVAASFRHANGHPVGEGSFTCASCHEPHRQRRVRVRGKASGLCLGCHREYRGPYVFPHHAGKGEGCLSCHLPHGSVNRKLLNTRRVRDNCLACHADLPSFHDQGPGSAFRNCLSCHVKIHGSNRHRFFLR